MPASDEDRSDTFDQGDGMDVDSDEDAPASTEGKGKAVDSGLSAENGAISYQVEVVAPDGKRTDVFVDLQTGKVLKMAAADSTDEGGDNESGEGSGGEQTEAN